MTVATDKIFFTRNCYHSTKYHIVIGINHDDFDYSRIAKYAKAHVDSRDACGEARLYFPSKSKLCENWDVSY